MSGQSHTLVCECVAAICSAYQEGFVLMQNIRAKRKQLATQAQELERSLAYGETAIKDQYDRSQKCFGQVFAAGDSKCSKYSYCIIVCEAVKLMFRSETALVALHEITTRLQEEVVGKLKAHWQQNASVDFTNLQDIADSNHDRAILALMQLQQRIITLGPYEHIMAVPLNIAEIINRDTSIIAENTLTTSAPETSNGIIHEQRKSVSSSISSTTPPRTSLGTECSDPVDPPLSLASTSRESKQYKPMATTVTTSKYFGLSKKTKIEPIVNPHENPLVDAYLADAREGSAKAISRRTSVSTGNSSLYGSDQAAFNSSQSYMPPSPAKSQYPTPSVVSFDTVRRYRTSEREVLESNRSIIAINSDDLLPSEMNDYAGFCKGAWRQQIGDTKRAMEARVRPGAGVYNASRYWQCKQCKFEGRLVTIDKKDSLDKRVFRLVEGIQFRWEFMFKTHVPTKDLVGSNPTRATFGCMFCCADGRPTPSFAGIQAFMNHLTEHRDPLPVGEVLYRMNCLVGRQAAAEDDFDINITAPKE